jgi:AhpD family alkylhydroperoxidase
VNVVDGASALRDITATLGFVPEFLQKFPALGRAGAWKQLRDVEVKQTAISTKNKELIGVAVAAQIPCRYCVIAHTEYARANGASDAELGEAIAMASLTRGMSTLLNGLQLDETRFRGDIDRLAKNARAAKQAADTRRR